MAKSDYDFSEVLISPREPYDKKTIWIHPTDDDIQIKVFHKGWKVVSRTKDIGLSNEAKSQVEKINLDFKNLIMEILKKQFGRISSNNNIIYERQKSLEEKIKELEYKFDKLNKKYSTLRNNE